MNKQLTLNPEKCMRCALCSRVCSMQFEVHNEIRTKNFQLDNPDCIKCGICVSNCPMKALSFKEKQEDKRFDRRSYDGVIIEIIDLSDNVREIKIEFKSPMIFKAGQFINLLVDRENNIYRAYSISKIIDNKTIAITIKKIEDGLLTPFIFSFKVGTLLSIEGPLGNNLILKKSGKNLCFIGIGIGITPFIELVNQGLKDKTRKIVLFHGAKFKNELYYSSIFESIEIENKNFTYIPIVSREEFKNKGRVTDFLKKYNFSKDFDFYICGKEELIEDTKKILNLNENKNLYFEAF